MTLLRSTVLTLVCALAFSALVWAQADPLQDANQLFRQGQFDRAMERVNSYLASRPKDARGRFLKGLILTEQNKPNDAIKIFTELSQDYPELPEPYNNLAVLYATQGAYDKAKSALETAIRTTRAMRRRMRISATSTRRWRARPTTRRFSSTAAIRPRKASST
jgi:Flp pilus assembly protein TadD